MEHLSMDHLSMRGAKFLGKFLLATLLACVLGLPPNAAGAQTYPAKPIRLITPYTPGSPVDVLARVVMQHTARRLGQPIVIDNRPGAGTTLGAKAAADAASDGYTLLIGATSFVIATSLY